MKKNYIAEHVLEGHPDKVADQISDAVVDGFIELDPYARVGCDCLVTKNLAIVAGEVKASSSPDIELLARNVISDIGYHSSDTGFDPINSKIIVALNTQSQELSSIVETGLANDQSLVIGYACEETPEFMPEVYELARQLAQQLSHVRRSGLLPYLLPDGKTQVCLSKDGGRTTITSLTISPHHQIGVDKEQLKEDVINHVIKPIIPDQYLMDNPPIYINETGSFHIGGPEADTGLTGRKIIVDTYGDMVPHGGGAFSGKDPTKIDRTGAYFARYIAKSVVANGCTKYSLVRLGYAKGVRKPILFEILTGKDAYQLEPNGKLLMALKRKLGEMEFEAIIERFNLRRPIYRSTACWGHFGRKDVQYPWEEIFSI